MLTIAEFNPLSDIPPELKWLANITNPKPRRACKADVAEFLALSGLKDHTALRAIARSSVIAWRKDMKARSCRRRASPQALRVVDSVRVSL